MHSPVPGASVRHRQHKIKDPLPDRIYEDEMQPIALLMTLCLVATTLSGAPATSTRKKHHSSHSSGHSSSHSYSARRNVPAAPTPERYQEIQQALASRGDYKGTVNGLWDPDWWTPSSDFRRIKTFRLTAS